MTRFKFDQDNPLIAYVRIPLAMGEEFKSWCERHGIETEKNGFTEFHLPDEKTKTLFILRWS